MATSIHLSNPEENSPESKLAEYQKNMKIFVQNVEKEISKIIDKYQKQIWELQEQIRKLKKEKNSPILSRSHRIGMQEQTSQILSPIKFKGGLLSEMETARSSFLQGIQMKNYFNTDSNIIKSQIQRSTFDSPLRIQKSSDKLNKSRFEVESKRKRQVQQDLLQSLEMGKGNLEMNTDRMFNLLGKTRRGTSKQQQNQQAKVDSPNLKKKKSSDSHNTSLSSICDSLNNSFHGKRAQAKSQRKRQQKRSKQDQEAQKQKQREKVKKAQGVKNLLTTMRNNIESPDKQKQIVKASKLLTTGEKPKVSTSKAKVMINPVAIDISKRDRSNTTAPSPTKNIQSILKNSSNVLSKSIQNISAISFHDYGPDY